MPTIDQKYVERLDDFTKALEGIVELLKQDAGKKNVDNVDKMLSNMNDNLNEVVKNMELVLKSTQKIESQNDKILEEVKAARKAKETGMFGNVADVDNKQKILDAVKVVTLIAAGVLAIGLAFKIIGPVDFLSVIAIGLAIVFITGAFVMISAATEGMTVGDLKNTTGLLVVMAMTITVSSWILALASTMTMVKAMSIIFTATALGSSLVLMTMAVKRIDLQPKDYAKLMMLPLILPLIAIGIAVSSFFLSKVVPMTLAQAATTVFVAAAIGTSLYLITKALESSKMEKKHVAQFLLLPIIIPALAIGLVASSYILSFIQPLSFGQMISAVFTAVTVGVLVYLMKPLIEKMKDLTLTSVILAGALVIALSIGLVGASHILGEMRLMGFKESLLLIMNSFAIGLSVLFLTPAVYILKSIKMDDMLTATRNIIMLAGAIAVSSWLFSLGAYNNVPDWEWAVGAGLSLLAYGGVVKALGLMKLGIKEIGVGILAITGISLAIMLSSLLLNLGNYDDYPSVAWAFGTGLSLVTFGMGMMILGGMILSSGGWVAGSMAIGALATIVISGVIALTSIILGTGNYDQYPSFDWAMGVGLSLVTFGSGMMILGGLILATGGLAAGAMAIGFIASVLVAGSIVAISWILSMGNYDQYPELDWAMGVGLSMVAFGGTMIALGLVMGAGGFLLMGIGALAMLTVAGTIIAISHILGMGDYESGPTVEWALGTGALLLAVGSSAVIFAAMLPLIFIGSFAMKMVANTIVEVADILSSGNYVGGPTKEWSEGVGLAIKSFAEGIAALSFAGGGLFGFLFGSDQTDQIRGIAGAMVDASLILQGGQWTSYPPEEWSKGVGNSVLAFAKAIAALDDADVDSGFEFIWLVAAISRGLIVAAKILNEFDWNSIKNYPSESWSKGVGAAINAFAEPLSKMAEFDVTGRDITKGIRRLSEGLVEAAEIIGYFDWSSITEADYPSEDWVTGVGKALELFVKNLVKIEKEDIGRGDLRILRFTIKAMITAAEDFADVDDDVWSKGPTSTWANNVGSALNTFVKYLAEIEKKDIGRGDVRDLNRIISSMINAAEDFADVDNEVWGKYPPSTWADGVGKSLSTFIKYLVEIEKKDIGKGEIKVLDRTIDSMIKTAKKFYILEKMYSGIWESGPTDEWANSIGNSIGKFVDYLVKIEKSDIGRGDLYVLNKTIGAISNVAIKLYLLEKFFDGIWNAGPTDAWATSIGNSVGKFVDYLVEIEKSDIGRGDLRILYGTIDAISNVAIKFYKLQKDNPDIWISGPTGNWGDNIENSIGSFVRIINMLSNVEDMNSLNSASDSMVNFLKKLEIILINKEMFSKGGLFDTFSDSMKKLSEGFSDTKSITDGLNALGDAFLKISDMGTTTEDTIKSLTKSIVNMSEALKDVDMESLNKLSKFSNGILVLSLIDEKKFEDALEVLDKKKNDIVAILSDNTSIKSKVTFGGETTIEESSTKTSETSNRDSFYETLLNHVKNLDSNVGQMLELQKEPPIPPEYDDNTVEKAPKAGF